MSGPEATLHSVARDLGSLSADVEAVNAKADALGVNVGGLAGVVEELANKFTAVVCSADQAAVRSWFEVEDPEAAHHMLRAIEQWVARVWQWYPKADLPSCWSWHPVVVEYLWQGMAVQRAQLRKGGTHQGMADWQVRYQPQFAERIKAAVGACSRTRHVPWPEDFERVAEAWASRREAPVMRERESAYT